MNAIPDVAKLTNEEIDVIWGDGDDADRRVADGASEKAWRVFMEGIPVEDLTAETQYATAWGKHSRDAEVADAYNRGIFDMSKVVADAKAEVAKLQEQLDAARESHAKLLGYIEDMEQLKRERDAALEQVRMLVEAAENMLEEDSGVKEWEAIRRLIAAAKTE